MAIKPILFSTPMVQAILAGRKTMTRRVAKKKYSNTDLVMKTDKYGARLVELQNDAPPPVPITYPDGRQGTRWSFIAVRDVPSPYRRGDILWVKETWYYEEHMHGITDGEPDLPNGRYSHRYVYRADSPDYPVDVGVGMQGWRPSIHMPKEAARIFLRVTDVRAERLQEIDDDDVLAEGLEIGAPFDELWNSLNAKCGYGWDANPWVWAITFERVDKPEGWPKEVP